MAWDDQVIPLVLKRDLVSLVLKFRTLEHQRELLIRIVQRLAVCPQSANFSVHKQELIGFSENTHRLERIRPKNWKQVNHLIRSSHRHCKYGT